MLKMDHDLRPVGAQREALRPLDDDNGWFGKGILECQGLEIVETFDAVKVHVIDLDVVMKDVNERKCWAGDLFFARTSKSADDSFCDSSLPAP